MSQEQLQSLIMITIKTYLWPFRVVVCLCLLLSWAVGDQADHDGDDKPGLGGDHMPGVAPLTMCHL